MPNEPVDLPQPESGVLGCQVPGQFDNRGATTRRREVLEGVDRCRPGLIAVRREKPKIAVEFGTQVGDIPIPQPSVKAQLPGRFEHDSGGFVNEFLRTHLDDLAVSVLVAGEVVRCVRFRGMASRPADPHRLAGTPDNVRVTIEGREGGHSNSDSKPMCVPVVDDK